MKQPHELNEKELITYSKIIAEISKMLATDKDFARIFVMEPKSNRILQFLVTMSNGLNMDLYKIEFDRYSLIFSCQDKTAGLVSIPKGVFDSMIIYC